MVGAGRRLRGARAAVALLVGLASACADTAEFPDDVPGVEHHVSEVAGVRWHWVEAGAGETVVLLHGVPETWHGWHRVLPGLAADYRVIALDLKGFGRSGAPAGDYSFCAVAAEVGALLQQLAPQGYFLVGQDWGAFIGACLAGQQPDQVRGYVHVSAPIDRYDLTRIPDYRDFHLAPESINRLIRNVELFVTRAYDAGIHGGSEGLPAGVLERRVGEFAGAQTALARYFRDLELDSRRRLEGGSRAAWESITVPVTIVIGDRDLLVPQELFLDAADRIPAFRSVVVIDEAAHFPAEEQPQRMAAVLREALAQ